MDYVYKKKLLLAFHSIRALAGKDERVMDYGCGAGALANYLVENGYSAVDAADIPSATLDFVRATMGKRLNRVIAIDKSYRGSPGSYSAIIALDCLEHTFNPLAIAKDLVSQLKPGGSLIVSFPIENDFSWTHTREAQAERPAVFGYLRDSCEEIVPEYIYRKR